MSKNNTTHTETTKNNTASTSNVDFTGTPYDNSYTYNEALVYQGDGYQTIFVSDKLEVSFTKSTKVNTESTA